MGKKLAIKGHSIRGKEVIKLLEMMGGNNNYKVDGANINCTYIIRHFDHSIIGGWSSSTEIVFTLEEFLEKYPFKVGDKVIDKVDGCPGIVTEIKWDEDVSDMKYCVTFENGIDFGWFVNDSIDFLNVNEMKNVLAELLNHIKNTPKEELEREFNELEEWTNVGPTAEEFMDFCDKVNKKSKYPTTYDECRKIIDYHLTGATIIGYKKSLLENFQQLLICRDAYWKIAGEELGLDKPWEPNWKDETQVKYMITTFNNKLEFFSSMHSYVVDRRNHILSFPTEEMLDAFYEIFKELIELCKELL